MAEFAHSLGPTCDWRLIALARSFLVLLFASGIALAGGAPLVIWRPGILWLRSIAGSVSLVCTFYALSQLRASEVLTLTNTFPIWVAILSWPLLNERPGVSVWVAAGLGVVGVTLICRPDFHSGNFAVFLALIAAFTSAIAMLGLHRLRGIDAPSIVVHFSAVATVFVIGACFIGTPVSLAPALAGRNLLLLLGVAATATVGQLFLTGAFTYGTPAKVSVVGLTQIVFALGLDVMLGDHTFSARTLCGIGLVMAPTAWVMAGKTTE
jgi:drug/metabolite transporter (DMT)-like permease